MKVSLAERISVPSVEHGSRWALRFASAISASAELSPGPNSASLIAFLLTGVSRSHDALPATTT